MRPEEYIRSQIQSPLSEKTSRLRTRLLSIAVLAIVVVHTGLVPNQIEGLGISFSEEQKQSFLVVLTVAIAYFLANFTLSAIPEYYIAKLTRKSHVEEKLSAENFPEGELEEISKRLNEIVNPLEVSPKTIERLLFYRVVIDVFLPLFISLYALGQLAFKMVFS